LNPSCCGLVSSEDTVDCWLDERPNEKEMKDWVLEASRVTHISFVVLPLEESS
jgi:hypothetical protein